jgi:hypothetical protein
MTDFSGYFNQFHQNVYGAPPPSAQGMNSLMVNPQQPLQPMQGGGQQQDNPMQQASDAYSKYSKAKDYASRMNSPWSAGDGTGAWSFTDPTTATANFGASDMGASGMTGFTPAPTAEASFGSGTGMFPAGTAAPAPIEGAGMGAGLLGPAALIGGLAAGGYGFDQAMQNGGYSDLNKLSINGVGGGDVTQALNPMSYFDDPAKSVDQLFNVMSLGLWDGIGGSLENLF